MHASEFFQESAIQNPWSEVDKADWNDWSSLKSNHLLEQLEATWTSPTNGRMSLCKKLALAILRIL